MKNNDMMPRSNITMFFVALLAILACITAFIYAVYLWEATQKPSILIFSFCLALLSVGVISFIIDKSKQ